MHTQNIHSKNHVYSRPSILSGHSIESMKDIFVEIFPWLEIQNGLRTKCENNKKRETIIKLESKAPLFEMKYAAILAFAIVQREKSFSFVYMCA